MKNKLDIEAVKTKITKSLHEAARHLAGVSKEAKTFVRRGENELTRISKLGRTQLEILALSVKKEQLYRQIGMKVWQLSSKGKLTTKKLKAFCNELSDINKKVKSKKRTIDRTIKQR